MRSSHPDFFGFASVVYAGRSQVGLNLSYFSGLCQMHYY